MICGSFVVEREIFAEPESGLSSGQGDSSHERSAPPSFANLLPPPIAFLSLSYRYDNRYRQMIC